MQFVYSHAHDEAQGRGRRSQRVRRRRAAAPAARPPGRRDRRADRRLQRRRAARRAPAAPGAAGRPGPRGDHRRVLAGHDVVFLALPHGQSARDRRGAAATTRGDRLRRRLPAHRRRRPGTSSTAATHAGTWPYGLPELPGQRGAAARRHADRRARLLPDRLDAGARAGRRRRARRRPDVVVVAASGTCGAGKARQAAPARLAR